MYWQEELIRTVTIKFEEKYFVKTLRTSFIEFEYFDTSLNKKSFGNSFMYFLEDILKGIILEGQKLAV